MTGSRFFPGGLFSHTIPAGELAFEFGPSSDVTLQWATYYDAADEAGESRIYGGIHVSPDDGPGRIMGSKIGKAAFAHAQAYWQNNTHKLASIKLQTNGELTFTKIPGYLHTLKNSSDLTAFSEVTIPSTLATDHEETITVPMTSQQNFYRVETSKPE